MITFDEALTLGVGQRSLLGQLALQLRALAAEEHRRGAALLLHLMDEPADLGGETDQGRELV